MPCGHSTVPRAIRPEPPIYLAILDSDFADPHLGVVLVRGAGVVLMPLKILGAITAALALVNAAPSYTALYSDSDIAEGYIATRKLNDSPFSLLDASRGLSWNGPTLAPGCELHLAIREVADRTRWDISPLQPGRLEDGICCGGRR